MPAAKAHVPAAPVSSFVVADTAIDMNGHMNFVDYHAMFKLHLDAMMEWLGLGGDYRSATGCAVFIAESHTIYEREFVLGERVEIAGHVVSVDAKRMRLACEMTDERGRRAALFEVLFLHVDSLACKSTPFAAPMLQRLSALTLSARGIDDPPDLGRHVGAPKRSPRPA